MKSGPYPEPVASRAAGAPSEAGKVTCTCCGPRMVGAKRAVPLIDWPGARLTGKAGVPEIWKVKSGAGTWIDVRATTFLLVLRTVKGSSRCEPSRTCPKSRLVGSTARSRSTPLPVSWMLCGWQVGQGTTTRAASNGPSRAGTKSTCTVRD